MLKQTYRCAAFLLLMIPSYVLSVILTKNNSEQESLKIAMEKCLKNPELFRGILSSECKKSLRYLFAKEWYEKCTRSSYYDDLTISDARKLSQDIISKVAGVGNQKNVIRWVEISRVISDFEDKIGVETTFDNVKKTQEEIKLEPKIIYKNGEQESLKTAIEKCCKNPESSPGNLSRECKESLKYFMVQEWKRECKRYAYYRDIGPGLSRAPDTWKLIRAIPMVTHADARRIIGAISDFENEVNREWKKEEKERLGDLVGGLAKLGAVRPSEMLAVRFFKKIYNIFLNK